MQHLYAPWRAKYFSSKSEECPFCIAGNLGVEAEFLSENSGVLDKNSSVLSENSDISCKNSNVVGENLANSSKTTKNSIQAQKDSELGVIFRAKSCFGIMNLYPYSPGHFMVIPYAHEEQIAALSSEAWQEMSHFVREGVGILQKALGAKGVNIGMNLGVSAGAGIAAHCHYHLVPRWAGDTNFITTIADTRVCGRDLNEIYECLKAEFKGVCAKNS